MVEIHPENHQIVKPEAVIRSNRRNKRDFVRQDFWGISQMLLKRKQQMLLKRKQAVVRN